MNDWTSVISWRNFGVSQACRCPDTPRRRSDDEQWQMAQEWTSELVHHSLHWSRKRSSLFSQHPCTFGSLWWLLSSELSHIQQRSVLSSHRLYCAIVHLDTPKNRRWIRRIHKKVWLMWNFRRTFKLSFINMNIKWFRVCMKPDHQLAWHATRSNWKFWE